LSRKRAATSGSVVAIANLRNVAACSVRYFLPGTIWFPVTTRYYQPHPMRLRIAAESVPGKLYKSVPKARPLGVMGRSAIWRPKPAVRRLRGRTTARDIRSRPGRPYSSISRSFCSRSATCWFTRFKYASSVRRLVVWRYRKICISSSTRSFFDRTKGIPTSADWGGRRQFGRDYLGACRPGEESHSLMCAAVSACRASRMSRSRSIPGGVPRASFRRRSACSAKR
jgi:hypothetical protein